MKNKQVLDMISPILVDEFGFEEGNLGLGLDDDIKSIGLDSFQMVEFAYEIERKLKVKITNEELSKMSKVADLLDLIRVKKED